MTEEKQNQSKKILQFHWLFILDIVLLCIAGCLALIETIPETGGSGFFIILIPMITIMNIFHFIIPQLIGMMLSIINIKKKSRFISILIYVTLLISVYSTISCFNSFKNW